MEAEYFPFSVLVFFPFLWCAIGFILSIVGGWSSLASHYGLSKSEREIPWVGWKSISVGRAYFFSANYGGVVKMAFQKDALYLSTFILFRLGHETLKLPYNEMKMETKKLLFSETLIVKMTKERNVRLIFFGEDKQRLCSIINA